VSRVLRQRIGL